MYTHVQLCQSAASYVEDLLSYMQYSACCRWWRLPAGVLSTQGRGECTCCSGSSQQPPAASSSAACTAAISRQGQHLEAVGHRPCCTYQPPAAEWHQQKGCQQQEQQWGCAVCCRVSGPHRGSAGCSCKPSRQLVLQWWLGWTAFALEDRCVGGVGWRLLGPARRRG